MNQNCQRALGLYLLTHPNFRKTTRLIHNPLHPPYNKPFQQPKRPPVATMKFSTVLLLAFSIASGISAQQSPGTKTKKKPMVFHFAGCSYGTPTGPYNHCAENNNGINGCKMTDHDCDIACIRW
ncbi:hypothetical protein FKW77_007188 [Venturia effusa]|uniref:Uncharacterized protein n=1 Tax=Venturia effusa TaxID=50376 RepID=A0A517LCK0_9PEZI|nr:hypothetical protein FKW77_007188 [Venturia effusa]